MGAGFLLWVVYQTYSISEWKTSTDLMIRQLSAQTQSISEQEARQIPDHEKRLNIIETQLPSIKQSLDKVSDKLDVVIEKLSKVQ